MSDCDYPPDDFRVLGQSFRQVMKRMTRHFFAVVHEQTGSYAYKGRLWHAYSYRFQPALDRAAAENAFAQQCDSPIYVWHEDFDMLWYCPRDIAVQDCFPSFDFYFFPASLKWLYVTTHESGHGIGPYFVSHDALDCHVHP
ncbi:DUF4275 family protein [Rubripirellula amarantea]|uniref:DUF4275 family protein n=1 Tax=Rubripirellula amarantea TaxID=2527999 RepID=UPI0011B524ED|nr:DUF4275 family protein [Rubripirellula amarantea]